MADLLDHFVAVGAPDDPQGRARDDAVKFRCGHLDTRGGGDGPDPLEPLFDQDLLHGPRF